MPGRSGKALMALLGVEEAVAVVEKCRVACQGQEYSVGSERVENSIQKLPIGTSFRR